MPDIFTHLPTNAAIDPIEAGFRLLASVALGAVVVWIYKQTRSPVEQTPSFPATLLLMTVLICMSTQVIGDNIARAFSLVGALSIVRFRTVVRDTLDTAFVIFAVVVGMAVGADGYWVGAIGIVIVGGSAFVMRTAPRRQASSLPAFLLNLRVSLSQDVETALAPTLDGCLADRRLLTMSTAKQGLAIDLSYEVRFRKDHSVQELIKNLNRIEGVQNVELTTRDAREGPLG